MYKYRPTLHDFKRFQRFSERILKQISEAQEKLANYKPENYLALRHYQRVVTQTSNRIKKLQKRFNEVDEFFKQLDN